MELTEGIEFDSKKYSVYAISVAFEPTHINNVRINKKNSFHSADYIYIQIDASDSQILLAGHYPHSRNKADKIVLELEHKFFAELKFFVGKTGFASKVKHKTEGSKDSSVSASRSDNFVSWIFHKHWIQTVDNYSVQLLCLLPTSLPSTPSTASCRVSVAVTKGSKLLGDAKGTIYFPQDFSGPTEVTPDPEEQTAVYQPTQSQALSGILEDAEEPVGAPVPVENQPVSISADKPGAPTRMSVPALR